jgi:membrane associated rhomboid family serine protease
MTFYDRTYRLGFGGGLTSAVKYLLIANVAIFLVKIIAGMMFDGGETFINTAFGMVPGRIFSHFPIWQFFTYMYIHGDPWHLIINMFFLWMFGCEVERTLGTREFFKYYTICGIGAGFFHLLFNFGSQIPVVGASGAIFGVMAAFAVLFPERVITLLLFLVLPVQIKAKYLVMIFAGIQLLYGIFGGSDGVAYFAHLGGMVVGFVYLKLDWRLEYLGTKIRQSKESRKAVRMLKKQQNMQRMRERVDEILDKINEVGFEHLNEEERRILRDASERLSQEKETES